MDMAEQDVYLERVPGSGQVYRVTKGDHNMNAPLYKAAKSKRASQVESPNYTKEHYLISFRPQVHSVLVLELHD